MVRKKKTRDFKETLKKIAFVINNKTGGAGENYTIKDYKEVIELVEKNNFKDIIDRYDKIYEMVTVPENIDK